MTDISEAVSVVSYMCPSRPRIGLILGSGLGSVVDELDEWGRIPYERIPGFPRPTVPGHAGELVVGGMKGVGVVAMQGRFHLYEGLSPAEVVLPVRLAAGLGARVLVVTNAAGALNPDLEAGTLMLIEDHINLPGFAGLNPLATLAEGQDRFVGMDGAYDETLRRLALEAAREMGIRVASGVYAMVAGPSYETPAEARFLRQVGADAVGMSTVPEVIAARWLGMRVLGVSCITNVLLRPQAHGVGGHEGVLSVAERSAADMARLVRAVLDRLYGTHSE